MDVFDSRYFVINKKLLIGMGLWPYDDRLKKYIKRICAALAIIAMGLPHFIGLFVNFNKDKRTLLEHMGTILLISLATVKIISSIIYENKLTLLYDDIARNWTSISDNHEKEILIDYSETGRIITIGWMAYLAGAALSFIILPVAPIILDIVVPLNSSRQRYNIMNGEFLIDRESNYGKLFVYDSFVCCTTVFMFMACDTMYAACIEHCLGLFAIVRYRLEMPNKLIVNNSSNFVNYCKLKDPGYYWMLHIIRLHSKILKFTVTLENTYEQPFFAIIAVNLFYSSLLCVLTLLHSDDMFNFVRYVILCAGGSIHLFYLSWPGQKLIDQSLDLHEKAYMNQWYNGSIRTKRLLNFFMLRCSKPCMLTAGGLYIINYDNFLAVMKKSISFMAVFSSFR